MSTNYMRKKRKFLFKVSIIEATFNIHRTNKANFVERLTKHTVVVVYCSSSLFTITLSITRMPNTLCSDLKQCYPCVLVVLDINTLYTVPALFLSHN